MSACEHTNLWEEAALFLKLDPNKVSDKPVVIVEGFEDKLWQYQWLAVYVNMNFAMSDRNGSIRHADKPDMSKVSDLRPLIGIKIQTDTI